MKSCVIFARVPDPFEAFCAVLPSLSDVDCIVGAIFFIDVKRVADFGSDLAPNKVEIAGHEIKKVLVVTQS